ncbi:MAG: DUF2791 family P-loop domain-containing protein [Candidatus Riflebacteria bacterium]|nr:DUF2791 family P-loop domain-containing protein [Candidatus Riflebacteria bacterium]
MVSGQYGSGKSFLLQMIRNNAMERNFVVTMAPPIPGTFFPGMIQLARLPS